MAQTGNPKKPEERILAYYFPQYHSIPENDTVFGKDFTDWKLFKDRGPEGLTAFKHPLEPPTGLGYYDPTDRDVREKQAVLAKKYGIDGFIYYHYWLENKPVMNTVFEKILEDNAPDLPFCLCFANESWKHNYGSPSGQYKAFYPDGSTYRQLYDNPKEHAQFLSRLFEHPNYIRINGLPVLFVYKYGAEVSAYLAEISKEINMYIVACTSNYCLSHYDNAILTRRPDAYSPFDAHHHINPCQRSVPAELATLPCLYGGFMGWNSMLRHPTYSVVYDYKPIEITKRMCEKLITMRRDSTSPQILAVFAWNEWAEGAIIEPNSFYREDLGLAIQKARQIMAAYDSWTYRIEYGLDSTFIDVTDKVYVHCMTTRSHVIPPDDYMRANIFGDPLPGILKVVKIIRDGITAVYDHTQEITLTMTAIPE